MRDSGMLADAWCSSQLPGITSVAQLIILVCNMLCFCRSRSVDEPLAMHQFCLGSVLLCVVAIHKQQEACMPTRASVVVTIAAPIAAVAVLSTNVDAV